MTRYLILLLLGVATFLQSLPALAQPAPAASTAPARKTARAAQTAALPRSTPEEQGISSAAIAAFAAEAGATVKDIHSFMVVRHGRVVAEGWWNPYAASHPHMLYSLSKSFTSTAVGLAAAEGRLTLDDKVLSFFPEDAPAAPDANLKAMRVRDLLAMASGHALDTTGRITKAEGGNWVRAFLSLPVEFAPGTHFVYNSGATYMLSAIVQKRTGQTVLEYLKPRLFAPLGIRGMTWETSPQGINTGGWGLKLRTEDLAKFGLLYLNKGLWKGRRVLPEGWVEDATSAHSDNSMRTDPDWAQGYCYQFWRCRYGAFRGDGAYGQFCVVLPEQDAVVIMTSGAGKLQGELELVWKHLLPAMKSAPLPADQEALGSVKKQLASLTLAPVKGQAAPALAKEISGKTFRFGDGQKLPAFLMAKERVLTGLRLDFKGAAATLTLTDDLGEHAVACGQRRWIKAPAPKTADPANPLAAVSGSGAWIAPDTYAARLCLYETPFCLTLRCKFEGGKLHLTYQQEPGGKPVTFNSTAVE